MGGHDRATDIWSFGATAFMMLYGRYLYKINKEEAKTTNVTLRDLMTRAIATNQPAPKFQAFRGMPEPSQLAAEFVKAVLVRNPDKRPCARECLTMEAVQPRLPSKSMTLTPSPSMLPAIKLVKQSTAEFGSLVNPIKAKTLDVLIEQLQSKFRRPSISSLNSFTKTSSLPISGEKSLGSHGDFSPTFSHGGESCRHPTLLQNIGYDSEMGTLSTSAGSRTTTKSTCVGSPRTASKSTR